MTSGDEAAPAPLPEELPALGRAVRASLLGPSITVPFANGKLLTGEWQQVVLIDFAPEQGGVVIQ